MQRRWGIAQFFELFWWKRYLSGHPVAAYLDWKKAYWHGFIHECGISTGSIDSALDVGCGPAGIFTVLQAPVVTAIDPLLDRYADSLPHFSPNLYPNVQFHCVPLETYSSERFFDAVFCLNAINHVADLPHCLERLHACLAEEGALYLSTDTHRFGFLKKLFQCFPIDILHPHQYDQADCRQLLTAAGFSVTEVKILKKGRIFNYVFYKAVRSAAVESRGDALPSRRG